MYGFARRRTMKWWQHEYQRCHNRSDFFILTNMIERLHHIIMQCCCNAALFAFACYFGPLNNLDNFCDSWGLSYRSMTVHVNSREISKQMLLADTEEAMFPSIINFQTYMQVEVNLSCTSILNLKQFNSDTICIDLYIIQLRQILRIAKAIRFLQYLQRFATCRKILQIYTIFG